MIIAINLIIIEKSCQSLKKIDSHKKNENGAKLIKFKFDNYYFLQINKKTNFFS